MAYKNYTVNNGQIVGIKTNPETFYDYASINDAIAGFINGGGANYNNIYLAGQGSGTGVSSTNLDGTGAIILTSINGGEVDYTANSSLTGTYFNGTLTASNVVAGISNIFFNNSTGASPYISFTGTNLVRIYFLNCNFSSKSVASAIVNFTNSNAVSLIYFINCSGDLPALANLITSSSAGTVKISNCNFLNSGGSTAQNTISAGSLIIENSTIQFPFTVSGTATYSGRNNNFDCSAINTTPLTITTTGACIDEGSTFKGGTASAISVGTGATLTLPSATIDSTNTNALTGLGTIDLGIITYTNTSSLNNITTQTLLPTQPVAMKRIQAITASSSASIVFSSGFSTGYSYYKLVGYNIKPGTGSQSLVMTVSTDGGSTYLSTGYESLYAVIVIAGTTWAQTNSTSNYVLLNSITSTSNPPGSFEIDLYNFSSTNTSSIRGSSIYGNSTLSYNVLAGTQSSTSAINALKLAMTSGNIASGTFVLYGVI